MKSLLKLGVLSFSLLLLVACGENKTQELAGGEDFPNAITAYADSVFAHLGRSQSWMVLDEQKQ